MLNYSLVVPVSCSSYTAVGGVHQASCPCRLPARQRTKAVCCKLSRHGYVILPSHVLYPCNVLLQLPSRPNTSQWLSSKVHVRVSAAHTQTLMQSNRHHSFAHVPHSCPRPTRPQREGTHRRRPCTHRTRCAITSSLAVKTDTLRSVRVYNAHSHPHRHELSYSCSTAQT